MEATPTRMRAAIECLPFENPKLSATAIAAIDGLTFAEALERATARSDTVRSTIALPAAAVDYSPPMIDAETLKRPFQSYRRFVGRR
jgi:hypothetical protein